MEETTTGVIRLKSLADEGNLKYPVIAVNDADTKHFFDNRYGTGQSTLDGITRATNILWAGKTVVIIGYGWCGRGVAMRARGMGANTVVCEVNHIRALEAAMDGHQVMKMEEAAKLGNIFITVTGGMKAVDAKHVQVIKDGAVLANSGHFNVEIDIDGIEELSDSKTEVRPFVEQYTLSDGRRINLLAEGRLINLSAASKFILRPSDSVYCSTNGRTSVLLSDSSSMPSMSISTLKCPLLARTAPSFIT
jgi:adenosylhomocysteinase